MAFKFETKLHYINHINKMLTKQNKKLCEQQIIKLCRFWDFCNYYRLNTIYQMSYKLHAEGVFETENIKLTEVTRNPDVFDMCVANNNSGLYFLKNTKEAIVYIGKSKNLYQRSISSAYERDARNIRYVSYMFMPYYNSHILEPYYIIKHQPYFNVEFKMEDIPEQNLVKIQHDYQETNNIDLHSEHSGAFFDWEDFNELYIRI